MEEHIQVQKGSSGEVIILKNVKIIIYLYFLFHLQICFYLITVLLQ
jgi:hypothetical protein